MGVYITQADVADRVSAPVLVQILDDNNDGVVDPTVIERYIADAESYVNGFLRRVYALPLSVVPNEIKRLCLDVVQGYLGIRHTEYARWDGGAMLDRARQELVDLAIGKSRLDVQVLPEPAAGTSTLGRSGGGIICEVGRIWKDPTDY